MTKRVIRCGHTSELVAGMFVAFVFGGLIFGPLTYDQAYLPEHELRLEVDREKEIITSNADLLACRLAINHRILHAIPGYEGYLSERHLFDLHTPGVEAEDQVGARCEALTEPAAAARFRSR